MEFDTPDNNIQKLDAKEFLKI